MPAILVVLDNFSEFMETFGDRGGSGSDTMLEGFITLLRQAKAYGLHFVVTASQVNVLGNKLYNLFSERLTLRLTSEDDYPAIVGSRIPGVDEIQGRGFVRIARQPLEFQIAVPGGTIDEAGRIQGEIAAIRELASKITEVGKAHWSGSPPLAIGALPKTSSYRQVVAELNNIPPEIDFLTGLRGAMARRWVESKEPDHANWLAVTLGIVGGNRKREMRFSAKEDGVHGLVAGGTGSGKSEMLMTMIIGLAIDYDPSILNFVLVDYKGGGAFRPFQNMPHCVDIITNLNKAAVNRMFTAINAEMRRRQGLNADTGTKDIVDYRRKGLHLTHEAYPHLFIIIDEYAEMIDDNPEYKAELESITRVGRAQGVNLVLASQRPKGVTDQMRANIKFRICLRVEETDTSREMLRRPDAALLPNGIPGRGYLQVGNENLELIQVSWTGENQPDEAEAVLWPDRDKDRPAAEAEDTPKMFDAVVRLSSELFGGKMAPKPWPDFLPESYSLQSPVYDSQKDVTYTLTTEVSNWLNGDTEDLWPGIDWGGDAMRPVLGLVDNPVEAHQYPMRFDFKRTHLAVFGDSGWGKTSFVRTLLTSLTATHSPNEFHAYILDLGGRNYRAMERLPHVGAVIYADEETFEERLGRLLARMAQLVDERQQLISNAGLGSVAEYNDRHPDDIMPAIMVIIDNIAEMKENHEMLVENVLMPLVRRSLSAGISFVATGNVPNNMPSKLYNLFGERITFKQAERDRYMDIVGRGAIDIADIPGRGYLRVGRSPKMFQAALPLGLPASGMDDASTESAELILMAERMQEQVKAADFEWVNKPDGIRTLPELLALDEMMAEAAESFRKSRVQAVIGQNNRLAPALIDLKRLGPHFAIVGPPLSGKSTALYDMILSLAERYPPEQVLMIIVDVQRKFIDYGGEHTLADLPHVLTTLTMVEQLPAVLAALHAECQRLMSREDNREIFFFIENYDFFAEELEQERDSARQLSTLANRYGAEGFHVVIAGTLDSGHSDLRRRVLSSGYGIGLRTAQALDNFRVQRVPAQLRGQELPVGRGFIVRAGTTQMVQVASPYENMAARPPVDDDENIEWMAEALDKWVNRIIDLYPDQRAKWTADGLDEEAGAGPDGLVVDPETRPLLDVLRRIVHKKAQQDNGLPLPLNDQTVLLELVKDALEEETGLDVSLFGETMQDIVVAAEGYFPEVTTNGATDQDGAPGQETGDEESKEPEAGD
jgi:DNA segregation ATPase FtsK/SpoIIIE-like protein